MKKSLRGDANTAHWL